MRLFHRLRGHWWFIRTYGPLTYTQYEALRHQRERETGDEFDPSRHGERMLRAVGASGEQILEAKRKGLA
jgi:hypothetical protein